MKIASYISNYKPEQIGGAQIPGYAFKKWCDIIGVDCEIVINKTPEYINENFDAVFFPTIGNVESQLPFKFEKIKIPYMVMLHAEFDIDFYNAHRALVEINNHSKGVVVIGENYWGLKNELLWYPCTFPEYLVTADTKFENCSEKLGLFYAARISTWKNASVLAAYSHMFEFYEAVDSRIDVYGVANNKEYEKFINDMMPRWNRLNTRFDVFNSEETAKRNSFYKFFWEVSGTGSYKIDLKRMNLSAWEAVRFGAVPIVNNDSVPPEVSDFAISYDSSDFIHRLKHPDQNRDRMIESIIKSKKFGYYDVMKQVIKIIEALTK